MFAAVEVSFVVCCLVGGAGNASRIPRRSQPWRTELFRRGSWTFSFSHHVDRKQPAIAAATHISGTLPLRRATMATPQAQAIRRWIMTGAVAAITITGTFYGAGLKTDQEVKKVRRHHYPVPSRPCISLLLLSTSSLPVHIADSLQERKRYQQASPDEIISQLTIARDDLVMKRNEMERKIAGFHEKKRMKALEAQRLQQQQQEQTK